MQMMTRKNQVIYTLQSPHNQMMSHVDLMTAYLVFDFLLLASDDALTGQCGGLFPETTKATKMRNTLAMMHSLSTAHIKLHESSKRKTTLGHDLEEL
jgi:hypothetical protein